MLLILSLLLLTKWFVTRQRKKLEYIELRENFINLVSHELKTPLASIRIMVETLQKRNERELSIKDYPQKIVAEVDHLWFMVDNLLSLNHIKSNELSLNIESQNLHSAIERVKLKLIENAAGKLTIVNNVPMHVRLPVDALLFDLVLINIVSNAIKYCDKAAPIVELSFEPDKQRLLVRDNACGVAHENWQRVFNDFYREDNKLSRQGTGIGLSLCHQIMQLHHGAIYIEESSAEGTLWCVELPLKFVEELRN
jgi:K+-sensing histidine kinase KdpD